LAMRGRGRLAVSSHERAVAIRLSNFETELLSVTEAGRLEWRRQEPGSVLLTAWSPAGLLLTAAVRPEVGKPSPCLIQGRDPRTGEPSWQRTLDAPLRAPVWTCGPDLFAATADGGVLVAKIDWASSPSAGTETLLAGFESETGALRWTRQFATLEEWDATGHERPRLGMPVFVRWDSLDDVVTASLVAVDARSGRMAPFAALRTMPQRHVGEIAVTSLRWGKSGLTVSGAFNGAIEFAGMRGQSPTVWRSECSSPPPFVPVGQPPASSQPCKLSEVRVQILNPALYVIKVAVH